MLYALILAGGVGSRLWPKSRQTIPKQFLDLTGGETMIQTTARRIAPLIPPHRIIVVTGERYVNLVREQLPDLPAANVVAEPSGKNTAPAIGLGALHIARADPSATIAVLTADHIIPNQGAFRQAIQAAEEAAQSGRLVTLGITPTGPETGYGYIHRGEVVATCRNQTVYRVNRFLEKPDLPAAEKFYRSGHYYWNSGMFIWQAAALFAELEQHMPQLSRQLRRLNEVIFTGDIAATESIWQQIDAQSIDFGLMEKADNVAVVPLDAGWNDVGSWTALYNELAHSPQDNIIVNAEHLPINSHGLLIQGRGKLVATIGVSNLAIVQTDDALLVCAKDQTQHVKQIVEQLKARNRHEYL